MTTNIVLTVLATLALASTATAEERYVAAAVSAPPAGQVWVPGQWIWTGSAYVWQPGAWRAAAPSPSNERPSMVWVEGRWRQGPDGWAWEAAHFEAQQPVSAAAPPPAAPAETVVYQSAPETVVYEQAPATVVVGEPLCPPPVIYRERTVCEPAPRPHGNVDISVGVAVTGHGGPVSHGHPFIPLPPLPPLRLLDPLFFLHHHH